MFERPHHQRIHEVLLALDAPLLREHRCYFGGGTAIALTLGEYRESVDMDFLVSDLDGYRALRARVFMAIPGVAIRGAGRCHPGSKGHCVSARSRTATPQRLKHG